jgi:hypothetical protein
MGRTARLLAVMLAVLGFALPAVAEPPSLALPVDCAMGSECFVQNHFDHDPGPGFADYTCGPLGYDGHDGTDIRVRTLAAMEEGVAVLAAAPGVVVGIRNDMDDIDVREIGRDALGGRDAGNGVRIDHGDGWFTQYSHLMKGSIVVRVGEHVVAGQPLGLIGLSGNTEFPHLHLGVQHEGVDIDPFVGTATAYACGTPREPLWSVTAQDALAYVAGAALAAGFAGEAADHKAAREGAYDGFALAEDSPALVFWAEFFGVRAGDRLVLTLELPGERFDDITSVTTLDRDRALQFQFAGRRQPDGGWPAGVYQGRAELLRAIDGVERVVSSIETTTVLP